MDPSHFEAKSFTVDHSVESLGIVFVTLPPLPPPPLVVKQVHEGTWAATAGIQPGCEVVELGGNIVGTMTREQFRAAINQRPLRIRFLPPNAKVWQQVAQFQKQVVRLSFQKVLLQKALRDEHENVKKELGIDGDAEAKQKERASLAREDIAIQRKQLERRKHEIAKQEAELETKNEQVAAFDQETQTRRTALKADSAHLASQKAELERARHDFDAMRKVKQEALEKERQLLAAERAELEAKREEVLVSQTDREDLEAEWQRLREEREELTAQQTQLELAVQKAQNEWAILDEERSALARSREELEEDVSHLSQAKTELQEYRSRDAARHEEIEKEALAFKESSDRTKAELQAQRLQMQTQNQKEKEDFKAKCKQALQQLETRKRQLLQLQKQLVAERSAVEEARKELEESRKENAEEATQTVIESLEACTQCAQATPESTAVAVQTESEEVAFGAVTLALHSNVLKEGRQLPVAPESARGVVTTEVLMDADRLRAVDLTAHVHTLLQARKVDVHCMRTLSQLLQGMVRSPLEGSELPSESASTSKLKQIKGGIGQGAQGRFRGLRQSESPRTPKEPRRPLGHRQPSPRPASPSPPSELPRSQGLAKKALAETADVRKLLAEELKKESKRSPPARSASRSKLERSLPAQAAQAQR
ncbi:unnamed protein product [Symbiodinium sp. CCMP2592]|nr:unnamed protein product [Symbiodinium sp. CCMP2592]